MTPQHDFDSALVAVMDIVYLKDLRVRTVIGVYPWERATTQLISFDIEIATDIKKAAATDSITEALDYKAVGKRVIAFVEKSQFNLVETLAEKVAHLILSEFSVPWIRLRLNKKWALRDVEDVGVMIERGKRPEEA